MTKNPDFKIEDHNQVFKKPEFDELWERKKEFEKPCSDEQVQETLEYSKTEEYKEKNFARKNLVINPAKACQPLGAILAAAGFDGCLPYVHGSQGCTSYFRSHFNRHFKEPFSAVSDSMTEDAAVFGVTKNMTTGLENTYTIYRPKMIAVSTTCMAEVIGDDLNAFIKNAVAAGAVPEDLPIPFAHTPSFVGTHITGYDAMMKGILHTLSKDEENAEADNGSINIIPGFDGYTVGNIREIKRMLDLMEIDYTILGDNSDILDTPMDGSFHMYYGGTPLESVKKAKNAKATFSLLPDSTEKIVKSFMRNDWEQPLENEIPLGLSGTDNFLMKVKEVTGKDIPKELEVERGQALDAMADSNYYLHGKKLAIFGDPSYVTALCDFYMEMGAEPTHIIVTGAKKKWGRKFQKALSENDFGKNATVHYGKDLWHLRSLLYDEPVDFMVGSTHGKILARELDIPLVRIGFPIFDRHHLHRYSTFGYKGIINILQWTVNTLLDDIDRKSEPYNFDFVR